MTESEILAVPLDQPERLFQCGAEDLALAARKLRSAWRPDQKGHDAVNAHINILKDAADKKVEAGTWKYGRKNIVFNSKAGKQHSLDYYRARKSDTGCVYVGHTLVSQVFTRDNLDLISNFPPVLKFASAEMRAQMEPNLPDLSVLPNVPLEDGGTLYTIPKPKGAILLQDVLDHLAPERLDFKAVLWIVSRLLNIACYLNWVGLTHNAISAKTLLIVPEQHSVHLLLGWEYSANTGTRLKAVPGALIDLMPSSMRKDKIASPEFDLQLIRSLALDLLGGRHAALKAGVPEPVLSWLQHPTTGNAVTDYASWRKVLESSIGRKFTVLNLTETDIYY